MEQIQVFEYGVLKIGQVINGVEFTSAHYKALENCYGDNRDGKFPYYGLIKDGIKFKQYVGLLCVGNLSIEVLPKLDRESDESSWHDRLIGMLQRVYKLDITVPTSAAQKTKRLPIFDVFLQRFLDEVDKLLVRGLVKCYHQQEENLSTLKGKIIWGKHLASNSAHKERFFVNYTTYDREHILNRIIRKALYAVSQVAVTPELRGRATTTLFDFPEVEDVSISPDTFNNLVFDRKTEDYAPAIRIAKLILLNCMPDLHHGRNNVLAMMFDMNKLWEEFVFCILRKKLKGYHVSSQVVEKYWSSKTVPKTIRPDIVIKDAQHNVIAILDTKWKQPEDSAPSDADLPQMFVYSQVFKTRTVALVYPGDKSDVHGIFNAFNVQCDMLFMPCQNDFATWENEIIGKVDKWLAPTSPLISSLHGSL